MHTPKRLDEIVTADDCVLRIAQGEYSFLDEIEPHVDFFNKLKKAARDTKLSEEELVRVYRFLISFVEPDIGIEDMRKQKKRINADSYCIDYTYIESLQRATLKNCDDVDKSHDQLTFLDACFAYRVRHPFGRIRNDVLAVMAFNVSPKKIWIKQIHGSNTERPLCQPQREALARIKFRQGLCGLIEENAQNAGIRQVRILPGSRNPWGVVRDSEESKRINYDGFAKKQGYRLTEGKRPWWIKEI